MRRKASKLVLLSTGAALAWFLDPVSGRDRRRQVTDQLATLTGSSAVGGDPTGGAPPPAVAQVQPLPSQPSPAPAFDVGDPTQAKAGDGDKVLGPPERTDAGDDIGDQAGHDRAALRTSW